MLRLSKDVPGFQYEYWKCEREILGVCTKKVHVIELYDLRDEKVRDELIAAGFVALVEPPIL